KLIADSLRYWAQEMHVDGFRFDLAPTLAREMSDVDPYSAFFDVLHQDPVLSRVKLIAEPWDVGPDGYQLGRFPVLWSEWNGKYRDSVRAFWCGDRRPLAEMGFRLTGSSDLFRQSRRHPTASINFVTAHDGFTLQDLVSYNHKHNEANGEDNLDGTDENFSNNYGVEGPTDRPDVLAIRARQKRNMLATLFFSQGVPMLLGGDEIGRTQDGNNNAYCQDDPISWFDWNLTERDEALFAFARQLIALRRRHPVLRRRRFFVGSNGGGQRDIIWLRNGGGEMSDHDWTVPDGSALGFCLIGDEIADLAPDGSPLVDDTLALLLNAGTRPAEFSLPKLDDGPAQWRLLLDTGAPDSPDQAPLPDSARVRLPPRTVCLLIRERTAEG
ncbi:MAG: glycogen debranching enzyme GlgX, partial [Thermomicrobiales bacterium]|nr:glycogen debranching enzyme GlgX [Thermomicrobiales bacterium]